MDTIGIIEKAMTDIQQERQPVTATQPTEPPETPPSPPPYAGDRVAESHSLFAGSHAEERARMEARMTDAQRAAHAWARQIDLGPHEVGAALDKSGLHPDHVAMIRMGSITPAEAARRLNVMLSHDRRAVSRLLLQRQRVTEPLALATEAICHVAPGKTYECDAWGVICGLLGLRVDGNSQLIATVNELGDVIEVLPT